MAEFICRLGTQSGEIVTRVVEAENDSDARSQLEKEGYKVFRVATSGTGLSAVLAPGASGAKGRVRQNDFLLFIQQFAALLRAGIPVLQSISLLRQRSASSSLKEILTDIEEKIRSGVPLSEAFEAQGTFPRIFTASLLAGEQSGAIDDVLSRYVIYLKRNIGIARKLRGALAYPLFLMAAATLMVAFLVLYIIPRMSSLFSNLNTSEGLPTVTVIVLAISTTLASNLWWVLPLLVVLLAGLYLWIRTPGGKLVRDKLLLKLPLVGALIRQLTMAQLARSLSTLISGGITVPDSWDIASQAINNAELRRRSQSVLPMIREGRMFTDALIDAGWMPELATDMIGIGESSGSLNDMLDEVANFYDAEAEVRLEQLTTLLEPLILVMMAGVVVVILLAIYLPIIQVIASGPYGAR
ncbi:MAG: type II secretion system F family protein [Acidobacteriota bacterium]|nr:MAG: type II secretion system F family protein [Acidobacteriota bacterium]